MLTSMLLAEDTILFLSSDWKVFKKENIKWFDFQLKFYAASAVMAELIINQYLSLEKGLITAVREPADIDIPYYHTVWSRVKQDPGKKNFIYWNNLFSDMYKSSKLSSESFGLYDQIAKYLEDKGFFERKKHRFLIIFKSTTTTISSKGIQYLKEKVADLNQSIESGQFPDQLLMLAILLSKDFADVLNGFLAPEKLNRLELLIKDPSYRNQHQLVFTLANLMRFAYLEEFLPQQGEEKIDLDHQLANQYQPKS